MSDETPEVQPAVEAKIKPTPEPAPPAKGQIVSFSNTANPGYSVMFTYHCASCSQDHSTQAWGVLHNKNSEVINVVCPTTTKEVQVELILPVIPYDVSRDVNRPTANSRGENSILAHLRR